MNEWQHLFWMKNCPYTNGSCFGLKRDVHVVSPSELARAVLTSFHIPCQIAEMFEKKRFYKWANCDTVV